jgi:hypothetical protein
MSRPEGLSPEEAQQWDEWVEHQKKDTIRKIAGSAAMVSVAPAEGADLDVQMALELGAGILMDKPLILVAVPGQPVPPRLAKLADRVLYDDLDTEAGVKAFKKALEEVTGADQDR